MISTAHEKLQDQRFQGKPVNTFDLKKSAKAKLPEKRTSDEKFKFINGPTIAIVIEKNKLKNKGIKISPKGIKTLKLSSNVSEYEIQ